jgi:hypothetical protein
MTIGLWILTKNYIKYNINIEAAAFTYPPYLLMLCEGREEGGGGHKMGEEKIIA